MHSPTAWRVTAETASFHVLPDAAMDLVWRDGTILFAGPDTRAATVQTTPGEVIWGLRLPPGIAAALLGVAASEVLNQRVELSAFDLPRMPRTNVASRSPAETLRCLAQHLWVNAEPEVARLRLAASLNRAAQRGAPVAAIAKAHDLSERSLRRLSVHWFGYGIKELASIHRLQRALALVRAGATLGETAVRARYADQAHFCRDVRRFTGTTPNALRERAQDRLVSVGLS